MDKNNARQGEPTWAGCNLCGHGTWHYCAAQPAKHTDDRKADTIPPARVVELSKLYLDIAMNVDIASDETRQAATDTVHALTELEGRRAETRIETLEATLRDFLDHLDRGVHCCVVTDFQTRKLRAVLAAPSRETKEKV